MIRSLRHALDFGNRIIGTGLIEVAGPADAAQTMAVGVLYVADISAYTANHPYTLPDVAAVGDQCGVLVSVGHASFELQLTAASGDTLDGVAGGTRVLGMRQAYELVVVECTVANTTWVVVNNTTRTYKRRDVLTAARTYYVRTDGSDSNLGLANTAAGAFLTIQKAFDVVSGSLDIGINTVTIQIGDGTYAPASGTRVADVAPWIGSGNIILQGNSGTPTNVVLSATAANGIDIRKGPLPGTLILKDFRLQTTTSGESLICQTPSVVQFSGLDFGASAGRQVYARLGGQIYGTGNYTVSGGGGSHLLAAAFGSIDTNGQTITFSNSPNFTTATVRTSSGDINVGGMTFTNGATVTGKKYSSELNGTIRTAAVTIPGDVAGTVSTQGQYL